MALICVYVNRGLSDDSWITRRDRYLKWCKENCEEYFSLDMLSSSMRLSFADETEAMGFKLRWC